MSPLLNSNSATDIALDSWPDFEFYPGPSPALDATMMRAVDPSTVQLNPLQASILDAILELCVKDPAALNMRLTSAKDALALLNRVENLRYPAR